MFKGFLTLGRIQFAFSLQLACRNGLEAPRFLMFPCTGSIGVMGWLLRNQTSLVNFNASFALVPSNMMLVMICFWLFLLFSFF
jgi:hypothetical protein